MFTTQNGNVAGGDIVGGDKITNTTTNNFYTSGSGSAILRLYLRLRSSESTDSYQSQIADKLQHYCNVSTDGDVRGLQEKLSAASRADILILASRLKEDAAKLIMRLQTSPVAQDIITHVLSKIYTDFIMHITPAIEANASRQMVDTLISDKVINPAIQMLGDNDLHITDEDVLGLLFFLGGNCHIRWDKC